MIWSIPGFPYCKIKKFFLKKNAFFRLFFSRRGYKALYWFKLRRYGHLLMINNSSSRESIARKCETALALNARIFLLGGVDVVCPSTRTSCRTFSFLEQVPLQLRRRAARKGKSMEDREPPRSPRQVH